MRKLAAFVFLLPLLALPFSCRTESTGKLRAQTLGDVSHPLAERVDAVEELVDVCGPVVAAGLVDEIRRSPYLQQTTSYSTRILWTAAHLDAATVDVVSPQRRSPMQTVHARLDPGGKKNPDDQWLAHVLNLQPDTVYCYTIRNEDGDALVENVGFKTAPETGSGAARFVVLGDSGDGEDDQLALTEQVQTVPFDFVLHVGDMAYDSGTFEELDAHYFEVYEDFLPHFSVFPVAGNHEYVTDDALPYRSVFDLPNNERWYSFDWASVHFVGLDTEMMTTAQSRFLEADLKANKLPWTVVFFHKPPFSSGSHGSFEEARRAFSPIFERYAVDLVLSGHDHHYERMHPQNGVSYVLTGGGGAATYGVDPSDFTAFAEEVIHFLYITIDERGLALHAIDGTGQEFDQLVLE